MPESLKPYAGGVFPDPNPPTPEPEPRCCRCNQPQGGGVKLNVRQMYGVVYVVCQSCRADEERARCAAQKPHRQKLPVSPEILARRLAALAKGRLTMKDRGGKILHDHVLTDGVPVTNRQYQVLLMYLGGFNRKQICEALGYAKPNTITNILGTPHMRAAVEKVERARLERIISGDFGIVAQARAASPKAMKRIVTEVDDAEKSSDRIKAAEDVLKIAGEMVDKKAVHHVYEIVNGMTEQEMEEYLTSRKWPERVRGIVQKLGLPEPGQTS